MGAVEATLIKECKTRLLDAKAEVLIISPYIDEVKLDDLIMLKNRNINVRLAFSDLRPEQYGSILRKLIHQNRVTDAKKKEKRERKNNLIFSKSDIADKIIKNIEKGIF